MSAVRKLKHQERKRFTYADYCTWDDEDRWELIDGIPYAMAAPNRRHQGISRNIAFQIHQFLRGKACEVYYAPFDVRLNPDTFDDTVVQPDIVVYCDESKLDSHGGIAAPEMAVEIISPSSATHDMVRKYMLYLKTGVREYWIVDPRTQTVLVHLLEDGTYKGKVYEKTEVVPVSVLEGCAVDLAEVFGWDTGPEDEQPLLAVSPQEGGRAQPVFPKEKD